MTALYIILAIAAVIAVIIFIPIDVAFGVSYIEKKANISLMIKYFPAKIKILPSEKKDGEGETEEKKKKKEGTKEEQEDSKKTEKKEKQPLSKKIELVRAVLDETWEDITGLIRHLFLHTLMVKKFFITAKIGTGDAMNTGIAYGAANMFIYRLLAFIDKHTKLADWRVSLDTDFDGFNIEAETELVIRTRIAYILKLGIMALVIALKILKINRRINKNGRK